MNVLIDSDILIWMSRQHAGAIAKLQTIQLWQLSTVGYIELIQGCRNRDELDKIKKGLAACNTVFIPLTESISARAMLLIDQYALSHGLQLGDALIAATALENNMILLTANLKHFNPIAGLKIEPFDPNGS
jgi:predicted nucleic acid-binding protein